MAEKDLVEKKLEDHNDVFADIWGLSLPLRRHGREERVWRYVGWRRN